MPARENDIFYDVSTKGKSKDEAVYISDGEI